MIGLLLSAVMATGVMSAMETVYTGPLDGGVLLVIRGVVPVEKRQGIAVWINHERAAVFGGDSFDAVAFNVVEEVGAVLRKIGYRAGDTLLVRLIAEDGQRVRFVGVRLFESK